MEPSALGSAEQGTEKVVGSGKRLTIETIADFVQSIRQGLAAAETVVIEFDPDIQMDITALQVFCSACKTAKAEGKMFLHRGPLPQALLDLAITSGSVRHEFCNNNNPSCFRRLGGPEKWES